METTFPASPSSRNNSDSCDSPRRRAVKRLVKWVSRNALKLASAFSPRRHHSSSSSSLSFDSQPPKSSCEEGESGEGKWREELCAVFRHFDGDGDGKISWVELKTALNSVGEEAGEDELREMIKQFDSDGDGCIDVEEFIELNSQENGREEAEKELAAAFRMFEGRGGGGITPAGLQRMMCRLGVGDGEDAHPLTLHLCNFIISQLDLDGDGVVNFHEFKRMMTAPVH